MRLLFEDVDVVIRSLLSRSFNLTEDSGEEFVGDSVFSLLVEMKSFFIFINGFHLFFFGRFLLSFTGIGSFCIDGLSGSTFRTRNLAEISDEFGESGFLNYSSEKHTVCLL